MFERRLKIERRLHELFPSHVIPLYSMISFSQMPYSEVQAREHAQRRMIAELMLDGSIEDRLKDPAFIRAAREKIVKGLQPIMEYVL